MPNKSSTRGSSAAGAIEQEVLSLSECSLGELRQKWKQRWNCDPPPVRSHDFLVRLFSWQMQDEAFGGLTPALEKALLAIAQSESHIPPSTLKTKQKIRAGAILVREWRGVAHSVKSVDGGFEHLGNKYNSLSDVARHITGTRWSGPRFFGLEQKPAKRISETTA